MYKIGVEEPPTIADMENELRILPEDIKLDEMTKVDFYINKTPKRKSSFNIIHIIGILIILAVIIVISGIIIYFSCCRSRKKNPNRRKRHIKSDTSMESNTS